MGIALCSPYGTHLLWNNPAHCENVGLSLVSKKLRGPRPGRKLGRKTKLRMMGRRRVE